MSEETNAPESDGTWSGLKKTIIGTLTTVVAGGGVWLSTQLFGGNSEEEGGATAEAGAEAGAAEVGAEAGSTEGLAESIMKFKPSASGKIWSIKSHT